MSAVIVTGDDAALPVTLKKGNATFAIDAGATVKAALVDLDYSETLVDAVTLDHAATGADWANSLVVVEIPSATTAAIDLTSGTRDALLEIQVDDGGKLTWFVPVQIIKGQIS